jgi:hypothetical protein
MKFLFLLWFSIGCAVDAAVRATAVWCLLYSFTNILWLQCFWIFLAIQLIWSRSFVSYISNHTSEDCLFYMRREARLLSLSVLYAPLLSILPTVATILLLSFLQAWTNLETHWLHTWLLLTAVVYILLRNRVRTKMREHAKSKPLLSQRRVRKQGTNQDDGMVIKEAAKEPQFEKWGTMGRVGRSAKPASGSFSARVIDV